MAHLLDQNAAESIAGTIKSALRELTKHHEERPPGSPGEEACQKVLKHNLEQADIPVVLEPFPVARKAFMAMPLVCSLLTLCSLPLYWIAPRLAPLPVMLALVIFVCELVFYKHILAFVFPKCTSTNLVATLPAKSHVKRRIILAGHADAAYEWRFLYWFPRIFPLFPVLLILSVAYVLLTTFAAALTGGLYAGGGFWQWLGLSHIFALPGLTIGLCYANFGKVSPGAADNLSGALCVTQLIKWMKTNHISFDHTEVIALVTGSEEAGLVGARAYIAAHKQELDTVPVIMVAVDTMAEAKHLAVHIRDLNGRVAHDPKVCELIHRAGGECGFNLPDAIVSVGASDAAAFSQAGIPAAAICAMDHAPAHYYHNRRDTCEVVEEACLAKSLRLLSAICECYDAEG